MSQEDDEFYCGSEKSEKEPINPFRVIREEGVAVAAADTNPKNALQEAIDRALRGEPCGSESNPHIILPSANDIRRVAGLGGCTKCGRHVHYGLQNIVKVIYNVTDE